MAADLRILRVHPDVRMPVKASAGAACFDLQTVDRADLLPGDAVTLRTGLVLQVPEGHVLLLFSRSGHGFNFDVRLANCVGVIDSDYRGELMVRLTNDRDKRLRIDFGDRIAQAMLVALPAVELVEVFAVGRTVRGAGGFGSTGA